MHSVEGSAASHVTDHHSRQASLRINPSFSQPFSEATTHLWPAVSTKYNTASPVNGAVKACEDDPAEIGSWVIVSPVAGLNHSTASLREVGIAERSIVKEPPEGE